jgi:hypothetical protein
LPLHNAQGERGYIRELRRKKAAARGATLRRRRTHREKRPHWAGAGSKLGRKRRKAHREDVLALRQVVSLLVQREADVEKEWQGRR